MVETGLTDQVLDDPREPYTQLLVSSVLPGMNMPMTPMIEQRSKRPSPCICRAACCSVVRGVSLSRSTPANASCCPGPSGAGKSTLLKMIYGNYRCDGGRILMRTTGAERSTSPAPTPRRILQCAATHARLCQPVPARGAARRRARSSWSTSALAPASRKTRARGARALLRAPEYSRAAAGTLPPATFSGGEQQRVNIARGFIADHPILLLDEPTASLDAANRARGRGTDR